MIKIGNADVVNIYIGDSAATAVYVGSTQIWSAGGGKDYSKEYFTLSALEAGEFYWNVANVEYSLNDGAWTTWTATDSANTLSVSADDKVRLRATANTTYNGKYIKGTGNFDAEGNIMSIFYGDNFIGQTTFPNKSSLLKYLFDGTNIINAENLIIPATNIPSSGLYSMFGNSTKLQTAPELPATTIATNCYSRLFYNCTSLIKGPTVLPATTLKEGCYGTMFYNCSNLEKAPELPDVVQARQTCNMMFSGCRKLNYVKCLFTDISGIGPVDNWLQNVSATGTFVKNANMNDWPTGASGIPSNWTIVDA